VFAILRKLKLIVTGDIGCYTLGALPPLSNLDTCVCMGASIGVALGIERVLPPDQARKVVAVIGDSTFFHSGLTGVLDAVYNGSRGTLLILDNRTTAMTGGQDHPGTGRRLDGQPAPDVDPAEVCRGLGVKDVKVVDSYDRAGLEKALLDSLDRDGFSVIVCRRPCALLDRKRPRPTYRIEANLCKNCGACLKTGCPALAQAEKHVQINPLFCAGCGLCFDLCRFNAIARVERGG
jgi:indolepyruvate ferredoxin oxidoreductase alpha subunit